MNIFNKIDYRKNLKLLVENRKKLDTTVTYQRMAEHMRIQKAYLSQVIKGARELSQDQLYMAMDYLDLKDSEREFLTLSLEYERSALMLRKRQLKTQIVKSLSIKLKLMTIEMKLEAKLVKLKNIKLF